MDAATLRTGIEHQNHFCSGLTILNINEKKKKFPPPIPFSYITEMREMFVGHGGDGLVSGLDL